MPDKVSPDYEYTAVAENLRLGATLLWQAFAIFFTINTLLVAATGFLIKDLSSGGPLRGFPGFALALIGFNVAWLAPKAIDQFLKYQRVFLERGVKLESEPDQLMDRVKKMFELNSGDTAAKMSGQIFSLFKYVWVTSMVGWAGLMASSLVPHVCKS